MGCGHRRGAGPSAVRVKFFGMDVSHEVPGMSGQTFPGLAGHVKWSMASRHTPAGNAGNVRLPDRGGNPDPDEGGLILRRRVPLPLPALSRSGKIADQPTAGSGWSELQLLQTHHARTAARTINAGRKSSTSRAIRRRKSWPPPPGR